MNSTPIARVDNEIFTEEALRAQDGKTCALRLGNTGPVIGIATLKYDRHRKALLADLQIDNDNVEKFLSESNPPEIRKDI